MTGGSSQKRSREDRISSRHVYETRIRIHIHHNEQNLTVEGWTRNLSEGGLNAFVAHGLTRGQLVTLEVPLQGSVAHSIPAQVVRTLGTEYGFQFTALSAEQRAAVRATVRERPVLSQDRRNR